MTEGTGAVHLVQREDDAVEAARAFAAAPWLALDTEFHAERRYRPELLLVQVQVPGGDAWLLDPLADGVLARAAEALQSVPAWVVHAGYHDLRLLRRALGGLPRQVWDVQLADGLVDVAYPASFEQLCSRWLGLAVDKTSRMSDWTRRPLDRAQQLYAAADVRWLPGLLAALEAELDRRGRRGAWEAACAEALQEALAEDPVDAALRRTLGGADLDQADLGVLAALVAWREEAADLQDRPPHFVVGDGTLRDLARQRPRTVADLRGNRRLSERLIERHGRDLVAAVGRGVTSPVPDLPALTRRHTAPARRALLLEAVAAAIGAARRLGPGLVLPRPRLEALALAPDADRTAVRTILGAWRDDLVGDDVAAALAGRIGVSAAGGDVVLTPVTPIECKPEGC